MALQDPNDRYDDVKRYLMEADRAFARAGVVDDDAERLRLIEEAERWLVRAERTLAIITGRPMRDQQPPTVAREIRSFGGERPSPSEMIWRRLPRG